MRKLCGFATAAILSIALLLNSRPSGAFDISVSVGIAPPELPVYEQPAIPGDGYIWTPGYWAWDDASQDYYWVPGTWVLAPEPGYLWTPGYWGWENGLYRWHGGYWGTQIGFYGGVNYGFGYFGHGYDGGYWDHGAFRYNGAYNNIRNTHITNVYTRTVVNQVTVNRVSFNGGHGGIEARPDQRELAAEREHHIAPISAQRQQEQLAHGNPQLRASANHGHPAIAATPRPAEFSGHGVIRAHGAPPLSRAPASIDHAPVGVPATGRMPSEPHGPSFAPAAHAVTPQREDIPPPHPVTPPVQQHARQEEQHAAPAAPHNEPQHRDEQREH